MKLYVSGPMTGMAEWNLSAFASAARGLEEAGYEVVNPARNGAGDPEKSWTDYLRGDLVDLLGCDGVAFLDGWTRSRGARLEIYVASELGMPYYSVEFWIKKGARHAHDDEHR